jgi:serine/threonine protein kinase
MGQGTFGQVVKCRTVKTGELVAIKVIRRQSMYFNQGKKEIDILSKVQ